MIFYLKIFSKKNVLGAQGAKGKEEVYGDTYIDNLMASVASLGFNSPAFRLISIIEFLCGYAAE